MLKEIKFNNVFKIGDVYGRYNYFLNNEEKKFVGEITTHFEDKKGPKILSDLYEYFLEKPLFEKVDLFLKESMVKIPEAKKDQEATIELLDETIFLKYIILNKNIGKNLENYVAKFDVLEKKISNHYVCSLVRLIKYK